MKEMDPLLLVFMYRLKVLRGCCDGNKTAVLFRRVGLLFFVVAINAMGQSRCPEKYLVSQHEESGILQCKNLSDNRLQWTIEEPEVKKSLTEYPQIKFDKGDTVIVSADGCVNANNEQNQKTDWRSYTDPQGEGVDRHYHGLIWIPGARTMQDGTLLAVPVGTDPVRIASVAGSTDGRERTDPEELVIDDPPAGTVSTLRLGYEGVVDGDFFCNLLGQCRVHYPTSPYPINPDPNSKESLLNPNHQCHDPVTVVVTIAHPGEPPSNPARTLKPFDVISTEVDENGFLFAPQWVNTRSSGDMTRLNVSDECQNFPYKNWLNVYRGVRSPCTQQASYDVPKVVTECLLAPGFGQFHGHVNWIPATFVGKLEFQDVSADKDADFQLQTIGDRLLRFPGNKDFGKVGPILTKDSQISAEYKDSLWLEFATYETTANFQAPWNEIKVQLTVDALKDLRRRYNDKTAIVTGLLDLDCVHDCHTELHPVFAMAVRKRLETDSDIAKDDSWAIFVRNSGNEGDCSLDEHYLDRNGYTFFLPAPPGAGQGTPTVANPNHALRSNEDELTWSLERSAKPGSNGVLLRISFTPTITACKIAHRGEMVHVSGELQLDWTTPSLTSTFQEPNNTEPSQPDLNTQQTESYWVYQVDRANQERLEHDNCTVSSDDNAPGPASDDFEHSQRFWSASHLRQHPELSGSTIFSQLHDLLGGEIGVFEEALLYNKTSQIQPNVGLRYALFQTPLGNVELDGAPGLSRSVRSTNGQNLNVKISDWMAGLKVQFTPQLGSFFQVKGGDIYRSASSGYASTPDFKNFHGHNAIFLVGGGIQPGAAAVAKGTKITLRISVDYVRITGTGENMVRITIGPQFQFHRRGE